VIKATIPIKATVELGDYRSMQYSVEPEAVTEEQVDQGIDNLRRRYGSWAETDRAVEAGDMLSLDVESNVGDDEQFINDKAVSYMVTPGLEFPVTGFPEQLVGMTKGEPKEFTLTVQDDYPQENFRSKEVAFKVTVQEIQERKLPELTDEFAQGLNQGLETADALRTWMRDQLENDARMRARYKVETEAVDALVQQSQIEYPDVLVEHELDHLVDDTLPRGDQRRLDAYLEAVGRSREELRDERREEAEKRVLRSLVLETLAERENIEVTDDDVTREAMSLLQGANSEEEINNLLQAISTPQARESLRNMAATRKTLTWLVDTITGTGAAEETPDESAPAEAAVSDEPPADEEAAVSDEPSADEEAAAAEQPS